METNNRPKFCSQCGNGLPPNAAFCPKCVSKIEFASQATASAPSVDEGAFANNSAPDTELKRGRSLDKSENVASRSDQHISSSTKRRFSFIGIVIIFILVALAVHIISNIFGSIMGQVNQHRREGRRNAAAASALSDAERDCAIDALKAINEDALRRLGED